MTVMEVDVALFERLLSPSVGAPTANGIVKLPGAVPVTATVTSMDWPESRYAMVQVAMLPLTAQGWPPASYA